MGPELPLTFPNFPSTIPRAVPWGDLWAAAIQTSAVKRAANYTELTFKGAYFVPTKGKVMSGGAGVKGEKGEVPQAPKDPNGNHLTVPADAYPFQVPASVNLAAAVPSFIIRASIIHESVNHEFIVLESITHVSTFPSLPNLLFELPLPSEPELIILSLLAFDIIPTVTNFRIERHSYCGGLLHLYWRIANVFVKPK